MIIQSREIPQANSLDSVVQAIINIGNGARTDEQIIANIPNIDTDRQGRYYRLIGELFGFVNNVQNNATLTTTGTLFFNSPTIHNPILINSILRMKIFQIVLPFIQLQGSVTQDELVTYLVSLQIPLAHSTTARRVSSLLSWLRELNIVNRVEDRYHVTNMISPITNTFQVQDDAIPLLPTTADLQEYTNVSQRVTSAGRMIAYYKNQAKLDRANNSHNQLVNIVAERIRNAGGIPKSNEYIDLATTLEQDFIFEMKSAHSGNVKSQIRKGISQLYEYRYIQNKGNANLVLVIETPLPAEINWMRDYIENDRSICLIWDGNNELYATENTRERIPFLGLLNQ